MKPDICAHTDRNCLPVKPSITTAIASATLALLLTFFVFLSFSPDYAMAETNSTTTPKEHPEPSTSHVLSYLSNDEKNTENMGAYVPDKMHLEDMRERDLDSAISDFVGQGFNKYFFTMTDFDNSNQARSTEKLLDAADDVAGLRIVVILLPPSEGGSNASYDWQGWVAYFNSLKSNHPSFDGFAIDDFNWISTRNDTKFWRNIDYMLYSNLSQALEGKRDDVNFYPVVYFEGLRTDVVIGEYGKYFESVILVSASYYNVSELEDNLSEFRQAFGNKPIEYIVYPTITYNYTRRGYDPPSDRLVMATLSIASRNADGIIVWHKIDSHVIQDYLKYNRDLEYFRAIHAMEQLQLADEKRSNGRIDRQR